MNYQLLQERLAIAHTEIERLLERLLGEALPPLPVIALNEPWHREYARVSRIAEVLRQLDSRVAEGEQQETPTQPARRSRKATVGGA